MAAEVGHLGGPVFGIVGASLVLGGVVSIVTGVPAAAHGLRPIFGLRDFLARLGELSPLLSAAAAALVVAGVVILLGSRRLRAGPSAVELVVLGAVIVACVAGASGRVGYAADGSVLPAAVLCLTGGAAVVVAGLVAAIMRD